ncbi:unnamed protein product, partial [Discosporangium mesarthrocarpum]
RSARELSSFDVVLTTYGTLCKEMLRGEAALGEAEGVGMLRPALAGLPAAEGRKKSRVLRPSSGVLGVHWHRVILDEAHAIRNISTDQSRACLLLQGDRRWAVTGTPIQNSLDDVAALCAFVRHEPWSDRMWWRKAIGDPYKSGDPEALPRLKTVLAPIMLRRTKHSLDSDGRPIMELPEKTVEVVRLRFDHAEREFYEALKKHSKLEFEGYVAAGTVTRSYIAILTLLLRLRQACNHPFLVLGRDTDLLGEVSSSSLTLGPPGEGEGEGVGAGEEGDAAVPSSSSSSSSSSLGPDGSGQGVGQGRTGCSGGQGGQRQQSGTRGERKGGELAAGQEKGQ